MQKISAFITSVIGIILISIVAENVCPEKYKKYVKFSVGLIILFTVFTSFFDVLISFDEINLDNFYAENSDNSIIKNDYNEQIKKLFFKKLKDEIENNIYKKLKITCRIMPSVNDDFSEISLNVECNENYKETIKDFIHKNYEIYDISFIKEVEKYEQ